MPEHSALLSVGVVPPLGEVIPQGKGWKLHTVWQKLCKNGERVAWCISPNVSGHLLSLPLLSLWSRLELPLNSWRLLQPTTNSSITKELPMGSSPSRSHGYFQFPGRKPSRTQVPMAAGESPSRNVLLGVGQQGWSREGRKQSCARARVSELRGYGEQLWQEAGGVGGLAQRDEQDEASRGEHSCLWWSTVRTLPRMGMPEKPTNSSWGINVLEKTLHIWVSPRLLLMLPAQESVKLGDVPGRAEIMASVCVAALCVLKTGFMWGRKTSCAMGKGQPRLSDWTFQLSTKDSLLRWGKRDMGLSPGC